MMKSGGKARQIVIGYFDNLSSQQKISLINRSLGDGLDEAEDSEGRFDAMVVSSMMPSLNTNIK